MKGLNRVPFRQTHTYLLAQASEFLVPAVQFLRKRAVVRPPIAVDRWQDIALVGADHIGDVLYRTGGLAALKAGLPGARLHFIASRPACELLETHPALDSVIVAEKPAEARSLSDRVRLLRSRPLDAVFCYDTGNYWMDQLAVAMAGISNCAGYVHKGFAGLVTHPLSFVFPKPFSDSFNYSVGELTGRPVGKQHPTVSLTPEDKAVGARVAQQHKEGGAPFLAVGITGNQPQGAPLKERMLETVARLVREMPVIPVFLGATGDRPEIEFGMQRWGLRGPILCGDLRLRECVAFLGQARAAFVVDSGLRHMANAAGIPVVYFRNLYTFKGETGDYLPSEHDLAPDVECLSRKELAKSPPLFEIEEGVRILRTILES